MIASGPSFPYLCVFGGELTAYSLLRLPNGARGIEQIAFLTDKLLLGYLSEGIFYLVDLANLQPKQAT